MRSFHRALVLGAVLFSVDTVTAAVAESMPMQGHAQPSTPAQRAASTTAFEQANMTMHNNMDITYTGNADVDFARAMMAHHQGAIDMAKVELKYGKAPEMKALAKSIINAQEHEIAQMQRWLKTHESLQQHP